MNEPYELCVEEFSNEIKKKTNQFSLNLMSFQENPTNSSLVKQISSETQKPIGLIENFSEFEESYFIEAKENKITAIFFFNTCEDSTNFFNKFSHILDKFNSNVEYFYYVTYLVDIPESELRDKVFLAPPCLLFYFGKRKYIEMTLDLMGENLYLVLKKIENNFNFEQKKVKKNNDVTFVDDKKIDMNQINEKYFKLIERMLKGKFIIEREYFYLKSLFFQDIQLVLNHCLEPLM